jgi:hypothetical protein
MTIIIANHPLGEALLINRKTSENQSPNADAKGDLFCILQVSLRAALVE